MYSRSRGCRRPPAMRRRPAVLAGVAVVGRHAEQGGGLAPAGTAKFGQVGAQAGGVERAAAGDRLDDLAAPLQPGIGRNAGLHFCVHLLDAGGEALQQRGEHAIRLGADLGDVLAQGGLLRDELAPGSEPVGERLQASRLGRRALDAFQARVMRQHCGIHSIVLRPLPEGAGEVARLLRVGEGHGHAVVVEALVECAMVAPGGFERDAPGRRAAAASLRRARRPSLCFRSGGRGRRDRHGRRASACRYRCRPTGAGNRGGRGLLLLSSLLRYPSCGQG